MVKNVTKFKEKLNSVKARVNKSKRVKNANKFVIWI